MAQKRVPRQGEFFRAHGAVWMALAAPAVVHRMVGRVVRAARVVWFETTPDGEASEFVLGPPEYVLLERVNVVLVDEHEVMAAHLRQWVRLAAPPMSAAEARAWA